MNGRALTKDRRGNSRDRAARRAWLMSPESGFGGDGETVPCYHCRREITAEQMTVDRFPLCGHSGGRYIRGNMVPSCRGCNSSRCQVKGHINAD